MDIGIVSVEDSVFVKPLYLYLNKEEKGETSCERKTWTSCLPNAPRDPHGDRNCNPGMCLHGESNPQPFSYRTALEPSHAGQGAIFFFVNSKFLILQLVLNKSTCINSSFLEGELEDMTVFHQSFQRELERDCDTHKKGTNLSSHICI